jgi:hypothetical protein
LRQNSGSMKTLLSAVTYSSVYTPAVLDALSHFIGINRLLAGESVAELEIQIKLPTKDVPPHLESLYEWFKQTLFDKPEFDLCKTTHKLTISYTSKLDSVSFEPVCEKQQKSAQIQLGPTAIFTQLFNELHALFIEHQALLKKKYGLDCQPIIDEMEQNKNNLPTDDGAILELVKAARGIRLENLTTHAEGDEHNHEIRLPKAFRVNRHEGGSWHIGVTASGEQFWAQVVAQVVPFSEAEPKDWNERKIWYAVLHLFEKDGKHISSTVDRIGTPGEDSDVLDRARTKMDALVSALGRVDYGPIRIQLFETTVDDFRFGLLDTSSDEGSQVTMLPNEFVFTPPWDGDYDT